MSLTVFATSEDDQKIARELAIEWQWDLASGLDEVIDDFYMKCEANQIFLGSRQLGDIEVGLDLLSGDYTWRKKTLNQKDLFAKALGRKGQKKKFLDLTAGLLGDSWAAHCLGFEVVAVERHPALFALARQALKNVCDSGVKIELVHAEAADFIANESHLKGVDVLYLDPMFSGAKKKALPSKEMQVLQRLLPAVGGDAREEESANLLELALATKVPRLVVKRPSKAAPLKEPVTHSFSGRSVRYDVYCR